MRNLMTDQQACTGLVQKYIGSAYDHVRLVAEHIALIDRMRELIEAGDFDEIAKNLDKLEELAQSLRYFHNAYLGPHTSDPLVNTDGSPLHDGALYYNTTNKHLYIFQNGLWNIVGSTANTVEVFKITPKELKSKGTILELKGHYEPGNNQLMVFVNATFQYAITPATLDGAYEETSPHSITFPQGTLEEDDVVTVVKSDTVTALEHVISVNVETLQIQHSGEKYIELPGGMRYVPGANNLEVFVDGRRQILGYDYTETDEFSITFKNPLAQGSVLQFKRGSVISNNVAPYIGHVLQILNVLPEFQIRNTALKKDGLVLVLGNEHMNDGGGGLYAYDPAKSRKEANGVGVIDSTVDLLAGQGTGVGNGCWILMNFHTGWNNYGGGPQVSSIKRKEMHGFNPPTRGEYTVGDLVWNISPSGGEPIGWVCTAAGTPGDWKSFGQIEL